MQVLYIHGKGGNAEESKHYEPLFPQDKVSGLDYQTFSPGDTGREIRTAVEQLTEKGEEIILIANSIGAFFSMNAGIDGLIQKEYFISPMTIRRTFAGSFRRIKISGFSPPWIS